MDRKIIAYFENHVVSDNVISRLLICYLIFLLSGPEKITLFQEIRYIEIRYIENQL